MAVRRLTRTSKRLLSTEQQHVSLKASSSSCPACRQHSSTALGATLTAGQQQQQHQSSWTAIAKAGQALFDSASSSFNKSSSIEPVASSSSSSSELAQGAAKELTTLLKYTRSPDPDKVWTLFSQADLEGTVKTMSLFTLHALIQALHCPPSPTTKLEFDVDDSTRACQEYDSRVQLVRLRLRQQGGQTSLNDLRSMLYQYHSWKYAPGVAQVWNEFMQLGHVPASHLCHKVFETMYGWTTLHLHAGGRKVAKAAAEPLVRKSLSIMNDITTDDGVVAASNKIDNVLDLFFKILLRAQDHKAFFEAMNNVYGFNVHYPGATATTTTTTTSTRPIGQQQVNWVLEMLADMGDLSKMVNVFEVFDSPSWSSSSSSTSFENTDSTTYFQQSFASNSTMNDVAPPNEMTPHPIGTTAFAAIIREAGRQGNGVIVRHYFDQLFNRWRYASDERISRIEQEAGIDRSQSTNDQLEESDSMESRSRSDSKLERPLGMPVASPERPYSIPATLVRDAMKRARANYDTNTSRRIRQRTRRILSTMNQQIERLTLVLNKFEQVQEDQIQSMTKTNERVDLKLNRSLQLLNHEIQTIQFHQTRLQEWYPVMITDSNISNAYTHYHRKTYKLGTRTKRLMDLTESSSSTRSVNNRTRQGIKLSSQLKHTQTAVENAKKQVLEARLSLIRHRLERLKRLGRAHTGRKTWDSWVLQYRQTKEELRNLENEQEEVVTGTKDTETSQAQQVA
ncbi:hypothetical protein OIO90_002224 [Microbotryomycetes sp. JL221]|nr:hypothetical protein OIO90_002224 [Microbotryomycetes sp. JL221]